MVFSRETISPTVAPEPTAVTSAGSRFRSSRASRSSTWSAPAVFSGSRTGAERGKSLDLIPFELGIDCRDRGKFASLFAESVHPHHDAPALLDFPLGDVGGLLDLPLNPAFFDSGDSSAQRVDPRDRLASA